MTQRTPNEPLTNLQRTLNKPSTNPKQTLSDIADMLNSLNNELPDDLLLEMGDPTPSTAPAAGGPNPGPAPGGQQVVVPVSVTG